MKKIISVTLAFVMFLCLVGCGEKEPEISYVRDSFLGVSYDVPDSCEKTEEDTFVFYSDSADNYLFVGYIPRPAKAQSEFFMSNSNNHIDYSKEKIINGKTAYYFCNTAKERGIKSVVLIMDCPEGGSIMFSTDNSVSESLSEKKMIEKFDYIISSIDIDD